jgi:NAD(P)H dehydrogenase (quinone)
VITPILILYYSRNGSTRHIANEIAMGVESQSLEAQICTVPPIVDQVAERPDELPENGDPFVTQQDLINCSGLALGSPTRFGNMAAPMKHFIDSTSAIWLKGQLEGKPACVFTSTGSLHGGQESTLLSMMLPLLHHGMLIMGIPQSEADLNRTQTGGTPYGMSHYQKDGANNQLSPEEKRLARNLGARLASTVKKYHHAE